MLAGIDARAEQKTSRTDSVCSSCRAGIAPSCASQGRQAASPRPRSVFRQAIFKPRRSSRKQALAEKNEDPGRALFILAQIALRGGINNASPYFEQALKATSEPKVVAWSHIYLGRILDLRTMRRTVPNALPLSSTTKRLWARATRFLRQRRRRKKDCRSPTRRRIARTGSQPPSEETEAITSACGCTG